MTQTARRSGDKQTSLPLASFLEDIGIYPRLNVDEAHVSKLVKVLAAGETLPPPVIDNDSKRIVDGWHRIRAYRRVLGAQGVIDVILREYSSENELLLDAISMNLSREKSLENIRCKIFKIGEIGNQRDESEEEG